MYCMAHKKAKPDKAVLAAVTRRDHSDPSSPLVATFGFGTDGRPLALEAPPCRVTAEDLPDGGLHYYGLDMVSPEGHPVGRHMALAGVTTRACLAGWMEVAARDRGTFYGVAGGQ